MRPSSSAARINLARGGYSSSTIDSHGNYEDTPRADLQSAGNQPTRRLPARPVTNGVGVPV